jgi:branched-chain amino acid transport system substrate-binding protein
MMRGLNLLVAVGLAMLGAPASAHAQDTIKIGILTELSGPLGTLGMAERDGFLLYLKKSGGKLGGLSVETVIEDTGNDPATALAKARKLLDSDKIDVLLGPMSSASAAAIKALVSGRALPSLVQATVDEVSDNKSMFRTTFPATADSYLQGYLAGRAGFKKAIAIAPNFNAGQDAVTWFEKGFEATGGKVLQKLLPRLGTPDFGSTIAQIDASADVGLVFMAGGDAVRFIKQFADYGKKLPLYGFTATVDEAILPAQGTAALGFVGASYYFSTIDTRENQAFVKDWEAAYKAKPTWQGVSGYVMGQVLDAALKQADGKLADKAALLAAMKGVKLTTPAGPFRFNEKNEPIQPRYISQVREVNGVIQPVVLGTIAEFVPEPRPPELPANLVLPK